MNHRQRSYWSLKKKNSSTGTGLKKGKKSSLSTLGYGNKQFLWIMSSLRALKKKKKFSTSENPESLPWEEDTGLK